MSGPDLHVFTLKFLAIKKLFFSFFWGQKNFFLIFFCKKGFIRVSVQCPLTLDFMQLFTADAIVPTAQD